MPAKKSSATREFRAQPKKSSAKRSTVHTSTAYRTASLARARQKREIEQQKREKLMFAMFIVVILVFLLFAILVFKKVIGNDMPDDTTPDNSGYSQNVGDEGDVGDAAGIADATVTVEKSAVKTGTLVLVDTNHPYTAPLPQTENMSASRTVFGTSASGKNIYSYYVASTSETACESEALKAFNGFADGFYTATKNVDLFVSKAYASGQGVHATGLALDLRFWTGGNNYYSLNAESYTTDFKWIKENAHKYGFIVGECDADFCLRYVGVPHASYMYKHSLTLAEYLDEVCKGTLAFTVDNGDKYEVYYTHATGDMVSVPLCSADAEHEISGDNREGVIVAVKMN